MRLPNPRQMLGVHYRIDSTEGLTLGETAAIRLLHQVRITTPIVGITTLSLTREHLPHIPYPGLPLRVNLSLTMSLMLIVMMLEWGEAFVQLK